MNKLLLFPLAFMFLLSIFSFATTGITFLGSTENYSDENEIVINGSGTTVEIPGADAQTFNIWSDAGAMVIVLASITIGILSGVTFLGSGISERSQSLIFNAVLFIGIWACLTVVSGAYLFQHNILSILWLGLTTIFVIGLGIHMGK